MHKWQSITTPFISFKLPTINSSITGLNWTWKRTSICHCAFTVQKMVHLASVIVLLALTITSWTACDSRRLGHTSFSSALSMRGGGSSRSNVRKSSSRSSSTSSRRKAAVQDDDDDDEDDEDDDREEESFSSRKSKSKTVTKQKGKPVSKGRGKETRSRMQLVPWGQPANGRKTKSKSLGFREKLEDLAKHGQSAYKDVYRRAKVLRSSAFEGMLLKATWPGNEAVPQSLLDEIIKHSIPAFKYGRASTEDDPYHMTLHKLWTKMCEKDWRTVVKSLYVLHCISRDCSADACQRFATAIKSLARTRNPKNPDHKYFSVSPVGDVDVLGEPYSKFIVTYATYVIYRAKNFSGKFLELKNLDQDSTEAQVIAKLKKAQSCITYGLKCVITEKKQQNVVVGHATKMIANDLKDLLKLASSKLAPLIGQGTPYAGPKGDEKEILELLKFYQEISSDISSYLSKASKAYTTLRVKIPTETENKLSAEKLKAKIAELTALTGGARSARTVSKSLARGRDEEEEDEEEEDEDEDEDEEDDDEDEDEEEVSAKEEEEDEEEVEEDEEEEEEKEEKEDSADEDDDDEEEEEEDDKEEEEKDDSEEGDDEDEDEDEDSNSDDDDEDDDDDDDDA